MSTEEISQLAIDPENKDFFRAWEIISQTNKSLYLTGKAGAGKTTFLKYAADKSPKKMVLLAPTGVAAVNAGGQTIHSFFGLPFGPMSPDDKKFSTESIPGSRSRGSIFETLKYNKTKRTILEQMDLLVIDEISMVRADMLQLIDKILRVYRDIPLPFGGVQMLLVGDVFQLPPIAKPDEWSLLAPFFENPFFFSAPAYRELAPIHIELKKIYRQKDDNFVSLLNRIRINKHTYDDIDLLNARLNAPLDEGKNYITLATHNKTVQEVNERSLAELVSPERSYTAIIQDDFPLNAFPTDQILRLKVGAQVMFIRNDPESSQSIIKDRVITKRRYHNGTIGVIEEMSDEIITVTLEDGSSIHLERAVWENARYEWDEANSVIDRKILGTFEQYPLRLAWAVTVHKSQGLTFDHVIADLAGSFTAGQVYVALSRCTSFEGLTLSSSLNMRTVKTSGSALAFARQETPETIVDQELLYAKADWLYGKSLENFKRRDLKEALALLNEAREIRDDTLKPRFKQFLELFIEWQELRLNQK